VWGACLRDEEVKDLCRFRERLDLRRAGRLAGIGEIVSTPPQFSATLPPGHGGTRLTALAAYRGLCRSAQPAPVYAVESLCQIKCLVDIRVDRLRKT
jgi:hypothetical protein